MEYQKLKRAILKVVNKSNVSGLSIQEITYKLGVSSGQVKEVIRDMVADEELVQKQVYGVIKLVTVKYYNLTQGSKWF